MMMQLNFDAAEFEKLGALGETALDHARVLEKSEKIQGFSGLDVCGTVRSVLPVLKTVKEIACTLKFVPGLKQACKALEPVIPLLESVCPSSQTSER